VQVRWKTDQDAIVTEAWQPSTDGKAVFAPNAVYFIKRLIGKSTFIVNLEPYNSAPSTLSFPIQGIGDEVRPLREACKW
jgi:type VI secretion system protein VasI